MTQFISVLFHIRDFIVKLKYYVIYCILTEKDNTGGLYELIRKSYFIVGSLAILIIVFVLYNQFFSKDVMAEDILGDAYFDRDAGVSVQTIHLEDIISVDISEEKQQEILSLIDSLE